MKQYTFTEREGEIEEQKLCEFSSNGLGFFETLLWDGESLLELDLHLQRLRSSLNTFFPNQAAYAFQFTGLTQLLRKNFRGVSCRVRLTAYPGGVENCSISINEYTKPNDGIVLWTSEFRPSANRPLSGHKSTSYADYALTYQEAQKRGAGEALLINTEDHVCEGATTNLFALINGTWITPELDTGCLPGVMRGLLMQKCKKVGIACVEGKIKRDDLLTAEAVLITNSLRRVQQVVSIDENSIAQADPEMLDLLLDIHGS